MEDELIVHQNKIFSNVDYVEKTLRNREFVKCEFVSCNFHKSDLSGNEFDNCTFKQCDFSMVDITNTGFRNAKFIGCKMLGLDFTRCSKFAFSFQFEQCYLDYSNFFGTKLRKTIFDNCMLKEVEFSETDLTSSEFKKCDLTGATFSNSLLEKVDFRTAINFAIDPDTNKLKRAKFSALNLAGLLFRHNLDIDFDGE